MTRGICEVMIPDAPCKLGSSAALRPPGYQGALRLYHLRACRLQRGPTKLIVVLPFGEGLYNSVTIRVVCDPKTVLLQV